LANRYQYLRLRDGALVAEMLLDWYGGHWDGLAERASSLGGDDVGQPTTRLQAGFLTGLLHAAAGATTQAADVLEAVLDELLRRGAVEYVMGPAAALARLRLAEDAGRRAVSVTDEPIGITARKQTWLWATDLVPARTQALIAVGRVDEAIELVETFGRGIRGRNAPGPRAGLATGRAILAEARAEPARAAGLFARAAAAWQALPRPYQVLLTRERQARCLLAAGQPAAALALLADTERGLTALGATRHADRIAHDLRQHAVLVPRVWHGGKRGYGRALSPRELDVVRLAIGGRTNRQIAEALYRSPNTVASQLKTAMRKLGVTSRAGLDASLAEPGTSDGAPQPESG
jgi:DNA-binding CsgD family transcriptional regulator